MTRTTDPRPIVELENAIRRTFARRDALMPFAHEQLCGDRVAELETEAAALQLQLAAIVQDTDPKRAARLRELAATTR